MYLDVMRIDDNDERSKFPHSTILLNAVDAYAEMSEARHMLPAFHTRQM
jgi:hypothetical protein